MLRSAKRMAVLAVIGALAMGVLVSCEEAGAGSDDGPDSYYTYRGETYELDRLFLIPIEENTGTDETGYRIALSMIGPSVGIDNSGNFTGTGDQAYMVVNTESQDTLTAQTYYSGPDRLIGKFTSGVYRMQYDFDATTGTAASPNTGTVTVAKSGTTYTIDFDVTTTDGYPLTGKYVGPKSSNFGVSAIQ